MAQPRKSRAVPSGLVYEDGVHTTVDPLLGPVPARSPADLKKFATLGIETRADLLVHYPWRYADSREVTDIASLAIGLNVALVARVRGAQMKHAAKTGRPRVEATITDGNRSLSLVIF